MSPTLTFDESAAESVLERFDRGVDSEGYIYNPQTDERETTPTDEPIPKEDFAGLERGSVIFLDDDFNTLVDHVKRRRED